MRFFTVFTTAVAALVAVVAAQADANGPNAITYPTSGDQITAGSTVDVKWNPTSGGTVALILRSGASNNLDAGSTIIYQADNTGTYSWKVPSTITRGSDYTIEIISVQDKTVTNYSPYFVINSSNTVASVTNPSSSSATMPSTSSSSSSSTSSSTITSSSSSTTSASVTSSVRRTSTTTSATTAPTTVMPNAGMRESVQTGVGAFAAMAALVMAL